MPWCEVVFFAKDGQQHSHLVEAGMKFEAAAKARDHVARMWWYDPAADLLVRPLGPAAEYRVTLGALQTWERTRL